ncbi:SDR family NAD(P)-dependent oxidoreductase [Stappia sp. GBMRC 2046]|uniref:3-dehydrosphinganine reductase n=1 Tax=Stappia sediminis TaxID=2692190 RepID=A0A7X3LTB0_9HYPH|nr:SDR family oxidoreductase [Stappia sediminis]MXN64645.1 SDR family NAD(P)-dependent oxidoreductase [Stappia sediminis]
MARDPDRTSGQKPRPAFITGGSSGIGLALAERLAGKGHDLALFARRRGALEEARDSLVSKFPGRRIEIFSVDVSEGDEVGAAVAAAVERMGAPGWAIANAGIARPGLFMEQPLEDHLEQMRTNYFGALQFSRDCVQAMAAAGGGRLVFVSSGAAFFGIHGYSAYAPSKFAMRGLAEVLRVELAPHDISVTLAYPPDTDTPQLVMESKTKPAATKAITAGGGLWPAGRVAEKIVAGADRGKFIVAPGLQMGLLARFHSVLAPALRSWQAGIVRKHHTP